jgi:uncharacterized protein YaiL (DUF2058 family)
MSKSMKDQLLALGLAQSKPEPRSRKKHKARAAKSGPGKPGMKNRDAEISLDEAYRIRSKQDRQQKERAADLKREQERQRREVNKTIKTLITKWAVRDENADIKRNFLYKGRIRSVLATRDQINEINNGTLGIVYLRGNYHLLPAEQIEEIRQFAPDHIPDLAGAEAEGEEEHPVPDDLIW